MVEILPTDTVIPLASDGVDVALQRRGRIGGHDGKHGALVLPRRGDPHQPILNGPELISTAPGTEVTLTTVHAPDAITERGRRGRLAAPPRAVPTELQPSKGPHAGPIPVVLGGLSTVVAEEEVAMMRGALAGPQPAAVAGGTRPDRSFDAFIVRDALTGIEILGEG